MATLRTLLDKLPIDDELLRRLPVPGTSGDVILEIDAARGVGEAEPATPIEAVQHRNTPVLSVMVEGLRAAAADPKVVGLVAHVHGKRLTMTQADELREAVVRFRALGKPTVAWAESFGEMGTDLRHYPLATAFDEIWLQPSGDFTLLGSALEPTFLRTALDKLDVVPQFSGRKEYKSAGDTFTETALTEHNREQYQQLLDSVVDTVVAQIAHARDLPVEAVRGLFEKGPLTPEQALEAGLIDKIGYRDEAYASLREKVGDVGANAELRYVERYRAPGHAARTAGAKLPGAGRNRRTVALVHAVGGIHLGRATGGGLSGRSIGSDDLGAALRLAVKEEVDALVLRVNSGGGSVTASDAIRREVTRVREAGIPVVVSMGAAAASGGYYISMPATEIVASPYTLTGSIGVIAGKLVTDGLWNRLGVTTDSVEHGPHSRWLSTRKQFSDSEWALLHEMLDRIYVDFVTKAAEHRGMEYEAMEKLARGRVWSGRDAHARGLVDHLGGLDVAVDRASILLGVARRHLDVVTMPKSGPLDRFFPTNNTDAPVAAYATTGESLLQRFTTALGLRHHGALQADLPTLR